MRMLIAMLIAALLIAPAALATTNNVQVDNARVYTSEDWGLWGFVTYLSHLFVDEQASVTVTLFDTGVHRQVNRATDDSRESYHVYAPSDMGLAADECDIVRVRVKSNGKSSTRHFDVCNY